MTTAAAALHARPAQPDIFQAASAGDIPRATELLDAAPERARARSQDGRTPLHYATSAGQPAMVTLLQSRGAELSAGPESPLLAAIDRPDHEVASAIALPLLANASDPNAHTVDGRTALQIATARGHRDVAEMLIHRGARTSNPGTVEVAWYGRRYSRDLQARPVDRDDLNGLPWTLVNQFVRVSHGNFEKTRQLLKDHPGLLNTRASWDELAVEAASHVGQFAMAEWLAEQGSPVSCCTAVLLGRGDIVKDHLQADRRVVRERGAHDIAILAYTAYANPQVAIAEQLLQAGAGVHERALGVTALHLAAGKGYLDLAALLIEHGADPHLAVKTRAGLVTPIDLAANAKQSAMEQFLRSKLH
jgi:ankyrin repeat protein